MRPIDAGRPRHLLHVFSTFGIGGPQVRFAALARLWGGRFRHSVFAMDGDYACWPRLDPSLAIERIDVAVEKGRGLSLANLRRFRGILRDLGPDVLVTSNFGTIEWALANRFALRRRHIHMEDGFGPDEAAGRQLARRVWLRRAALGGTTQVIVPSRGLERIAVTTWRVPARRVHHIPNGIDTARFAVEPSPTEARDVPTIGFVGALRPEKNVARLLRAFAALPSGLAARLVVVGDGPDRAALEAFASQLGVSGRVRFEGALSEPERVLRGLDIFALSSDTEQMPFSLLEAMAAGLPAVATDVGDVAVMLASPNRPFVTDRDEHALSKAMAVLLADPKRRAMIGKANQAKAQAEFDEARMAARHAALIDHGDENAR